MHQTVNNLSVRAGGMCMPCTGSAQPQAAARAPYSLVRRGVGRDRSMQPSYTACPCHASVLEARAARKAGVRQAARLLAESSDAL